MALKAADLLGRLSRAQQVGIVEDRFQIHGVELVIRNLTPDQHDMVTQDVSEVPEDQYMMAVQKAQICRAIVEIDGVDLRDSPLIESEVAQEGGKTVYRHVERHTWVLENLVVHWGREAVFTVWRKLAELFVRAEKQMVSTIKFDIATETAEEKTRRLLLEAQEAAQDLPQPMVTAVWGEFGWMPRTTDSELAEVAKRAKDWQDAQLAKAAQDASEEPAEAPAPAAQPRTARPLMPPVVREEAPVTAAPVKVPVDPQTLMAARQPLNQEAVQPLRPEQIMAGRRAAYQADLEGLTELDPNQANEALGSTAQTAYRLQESAELVKPLGSTSDRAAVDAAPVGGLNPRFNPRR